jgi:hypothetical protein
MKRTLRVLTLGLLVAVFSAPGAAAPVPEVQIPPGVIAELRRLESRFDSALFQDCANDKCFSRGCSYLAHDTVDKPRSGSLPGLGENKGEGPGAIGAQEYLRAAKCEFAFESTIPVKDLRSLVQRLEQKLSGGFLNVTVESRSLPPLPNSLKATPQASPTATAEPKASPSPVASPTPQVSPGPTGSFWSGGQAARELWLQLLPHFSWMIAVFLVTLAGLVLLWAWRRLGIASVEEKAMLAALNEGETNAEEPAVPLDSNVTLESKDTNSVSLLKEEHLQGVYATEQAAQWKERMSKDPAILEDVAAQWLKDGEFSLLAKASLIFDIEQVSFLPKGLEWAPEKLIFSNYLKNLDFTQLPSDFEFYKTLHQHVVAAAIVGDSELESYSRLREEFGAVGIAQLVEKMPTNLAALLFAIAPSDALPETALLLAPQVRFAIGKTLLESNRASEQELSAVFSYVKSACVGEPLPHFETQDFGAFDRGRILEVERALSVLFSRMADGEKQVLLDQVKADHSGLLHTWALGVFHPRMLSSLPDAMRNAFFLEVNTRELVEWLYTLPEILRTEFLRTAPQVVQASAYNVPSLTNKIQTERSVKNVESRFVALLKREYAAGTLRFEEIV